MREVATWNWEKGTSVSVDLGEIREQYEQVHELVVSDDGERIAVPVVTEDESFRVCVNGEPWEGEYEKAWDLKFGPDGRLIALVRIDDMWTVAVDGETWPGEWEFVWDTQTSTDGSVIAAQVKDEMEYTIAVNGAAWESRFAACRGYALSADGSTAAALMQLQSLAEGDIFGFLEGAWGVVVNGTAWDRRFINVWGPAVTPDGSRVAAEVRLDICDYSVAENGEPWPARFGLVWEPSWHDGALIAPVKAADGWTLAENGEPVWERRFVQLWNQRFSPDGSRVAAVVSPSFTRWTVAVDDEPWDLTVSDVVLPPVFSPDSTKLACAVRDQGRWTVAVDGRKWSDGFDMVWDPVFHADGSVLAKVERDGKYAIAKDGAIWSPWFDGLREPVLSPDGSLVLVRCIENDIYNRRVVPYGATYADK